jgi:signal transduction histidine kinase
VDHSAEIERLRQQLEERNDFLGVVVHELRNPLHTLTLQLAAARKLAESSNVPMLAKRIRTSQTTLQRYLDQATLLLELARVNSQGQDLNFQAIDLASLLANLVEQNRPTALHYRIDLQASLPDRCVVPTDPASLQQIFEHLLSNAFKHSAAKNVMVLLRQAGNHAVVSVADDGKGIAAGERDRIFDRIGRKDATPQRTASCRGLWIAKLLSDALGARISLQNNSTGGSVFTIEIPLRQAETVAP